ncbi:hypothetical protein M9H77_11061 [Catharanthus roseus]|uniref:Uncharacterized protein n=1 Tax=Catharanthus roseus TaxID=4058 RepID=A0ACC0BDJ1_CATRO|nr:hypothetical protein M9H77_11061 [Catharanthus roseus]
MLGAYEIERYRRGSRGWAGRSGPRSPLQQAAHTTASSSSPARRSWAEVSVAADSTDSDPWLDSDGAADGSPCWAAANSSTRAGLSCTSTGDDSRRSSVAQAVDGPSRRGGTAGAAAAGEGMQALAEPLGGSEPHNFWARFRVKKKLCSLAPHPKPNSPLLPRLSFFLHYLSRTTLPLPFSSLLGDSDSVHFLFSSRRSAAARRSDVLGAPLLLLLTAASLLLSHIGFRLLIVLISYLKILIKILSFDRGIYPVNDSPSKFSVLVLSLNTENNSFLFHWFLKVPLLPYKFSLSQSRSEEIKLFSAENNHFRQASESPSDFCPVKQKSLGIFASRSGPPRELSPSWTKMQDTFRQLGRK